MMRDRDGEITTLARALESECGLRGPELQRACLIAMEWAAELAEIAAHRDARWSDLGKRIAEAV